MHTQRFKVVVVGGGHAGVEAAWAAANLLPVQPGEAPTVALVTLDPTKIGVMSCNPAIGGLAKGQLVREVDALGGLMGLATDATGIQFRVLNTSKGPAVHGPRAQCDKHAYAQAVQAMIAARPEIAVIAGSVERLIVNGRRLHAADIAAPAGAIRIEADALVLTTGTFMRALMRCGETKTQGGRFGEAAAVGISSALRDLGFELGRLKTGTPPRLRRDTIRWEELPPQHGDAAPAPFSELSGVGVACAFAPSIAAFPVLPQVECRQTSTNARAHALIRENLHRAPMYSGQIESVGPRYCPSIEDKVVRFAQRESHGVFLEPESLRDDWIYCNGISTSLPPDVQDRIVRSMPGCENAQIYRYGYAVEYDMVRPHQITAGGMTKLVDGLFLAGQINGTSGYEEAAAQGLVAGLNAARFARGQGEYIFGRDAAYIGVLMDDLVTKTPVEPYRMFTSRAEHRLLLRADNAPDRLTPIADELGLLTGTLGTLRRDALARKRDRMKQLHALIDSATWHDEPLAKAIRSDVFELEQLREALPAEPFDRGPWMTALADRRYEAYIVRQRAEIRRHAEMEHRRLPEVIDYMGLPHLRNEARQALHRFRPRTFGQAGRLEGITPADLTLLAVLVKGR
ncbi:MAG: tRNA uridine-5-carboxymethylaminomethyl(34) synthesis enzyme MnmG [Planctomycetes bacterium]|nr:tRNA uridine-5-carboxymethylaminomethyl(34) synthesis enzyme MnmG [Planctomycetota bacterium]